MTFKFSKMSFSFLLFLLLCGWQDLLDYQATMKPTAVADEMFPEGAGTYVDADEAAGSVGLLMDLSAVNEKTVHDNFFNDFEDLFDDEDIS